MNFFLLFLLFGLIKSGLPLSCYRCRNGYATSEVCSDQLPRGFEIECDQPRAQCFESIQWFNGGALRLAVRDCWTPPGNRTVGGFCENYSSREGVLKFCRNCSEDLCNTNTIYYPVKLLNCYL